MARLDPPDFERLTDAQQRVYDAIVAGPRGRVAGPLAVWLHRPELADKAQDLGAYCRFGTSLAPNLSELAVIAGARHWGAEFEWAAHARFARDAGVAESVIAAIRDGETPSFERDDEALVYAIAREILTTRRLSDPLYARGMAELGTDGMVDLVGILGYYSLIAMTINVFDVRPPEPVAGWRDDGSLG